MTIPEGWDWNKRIPMWDFHELTLDKFPEWETVATELCYAVPASICITVIHKKDRSSRDIAIEVDDWCKGKFYYRDFTDDGLPFVDDGETYHARFWFQLEEDAIEFHKKYGGDYNGR